LKPFELPMNIAEILARRGCDCILNLRQRIQRVYLHTRRYPAEIELQQAGVGASLQRDESNLYALRGGADSLELEVKASFRMK
jgi:hypothetical protein